MKNEVITKQVFLSHIRKDKAIANPLAKELRIQGFKVWTEQHLSPSEDWSEEREKALKESNSMIALLNPHSFSSSWVRSDLEHAFFNERYKNRLLPVLIGGSSELDFIRLPWFVTKLKYLHFQKDEPSEMIAKKVLNTFLEILKT